MEYLSTKVWLDGHSRFRETGMWLLDWISVVNVVCRNSRYLISTRYMRDGFSIHIRLLVFEVKVLYLFKDSMVLGEESEG